MPSADSCVAVREPRDPLGSPAADIAQTFRGKRNRRETSAPAGLRVALTAVAVMIGIRERLRAARRGRRTGRVGAVPQAVLDRALGLGQAVGADTVRLAAGTLVRVLHEYAIEEIHGIELRAPKTGETRRVGQALLGRAASLAGVSRPVEFAARADAHRDAVEGPLVNTVERPAVVDGGAHVEEDLVRGQLHIDLMVTAGQREVAALPRSGVLHVEFGAVGRWRPLRRALGQRRATTRPEFPPLVPVEQHQMVHLRFVRSHALFLARAGILTHDRQETDGDTAPGLALPRLRVKRGHQRRAVSIEVIEIHQM